MFKFGFNVEEETDSPFASNTTTEKASPHDVKTIEWYEPQEIIPDDKITDSMDLYRLNSKHNTIGEITLSYIVSGFLLKNIISNEVTSKDISKAEENHSDLIPGEYEGGAKIWECTYDLLTYLSFNYSINMWQDKDVLDLGCGSGLLGIYAFKCGAKVHFQDYNKDVLEEITMPNVLLNAKQLADAVNLKEISKNTKFYSGDWSKYAKFTNDKFDIILTSETIYNPENQEKLLNTLHGKLKSNGFALVAAKIFYFGVGGGLRQFEELIKSDERFRSKVLWSSTVGIGREILELSHNK